MMPDWQNICGISNSQQKFCQHCACWWPSTCRHCDIQIGHLTHWGRETHICIQCGKLNFGGTRLKTEVPYMFYTKFHLPWPIFYSPSLKCTRIGEWASVSFPHWHHPTSPSLVQVMACRLFGAKPLSEPMLDYCQLNPWEHISVKF